MVPRRPTRRGRRFSKAGNAPHLLPRPCGFAVLLQSSNGTVNFSCASQYWTRAWSNALVTAWSLRPVAASISSKTRRTSSPRFTLSWLDCFMSTSVSRQQIASIIGFRCFLKNLLFLLTAGIQTPFSRPFQQHASSENFS